MKFIIGSYVGLAILLGVWLLDESAKVYVGAMSFADVMSFLIFCGLLVENFRSNK